MFTHLISLVKKKRKSAAVERENVWILTLHVLHQCSKQKRALCCPSFGKYALSQSVQCQCRSSQHMENAVFKLNQIANRKSVNVHNRNHGELGFWTPSMSMREHLNEAQNKWKWNVHTLILTSSRVQIIFWADVVNSTIFQIYSSESR